MKGIVTTLLILLLITASLCAEKKNVALLMVEKMDRESASIVKSMENDDFEEIFKDNPDFNLLDIGKTTKAFEKTGIESPFMMLPEEIVALAPTLGADILMWYRVSNNGNRTYSIESRIMNVANQKIIPLSLNETPTKKSDRQDYLRNNILPKLREFVVGEIDVNYRIAIQQFDQGDYQGSRNTLLQLLKLDAAHAGAYAFLAYMAYVEAKYQETIEWCDKGLAHNPRNTDLLIHKSNAFREMRQPQKAIETMSLVAEINNNEAGWLSLGNVYFESGDNTKAKQALEKALQANPNSVKSKYLLGTILYAEQNFEAALPYLEAATEAFPEDEDLSKKLALTFKATGKTKDAIDRMRQYLTGKPEDLKAYRNLSSSLRAYAVELSDNGDYDGAMKHYEEAATTLKNMLQRDASDNTTLLFIAGIYREMSTLATDKGRGADASKYNREAITVLNDMIKKNPADVRSYNILAGLYFAQDNIGEAEKTANTAIEKDPSAYEPYMMLFRIYQKKGIDRYNGFTDIKAQMDREQLFGQQYDMMKAKLVAARDEAHKLFQTSLSNLNKAGQKTDKTDIQNEVKKRRENLMKYIEATKPSEFTD